MPQPYESIRELALLLERVPEAASRGYEAQGRQLAARVDQCLADDPELGGPAGLDLAAATFSGGSDHVRFFSSVLGLRLAELLAATMPWAYRVLQARGCPAAGTARMFRHWEEAVGQLLPPDQAPPVQAVYRWILERHHHWVALAQSAASAAPAPPSPWAAVRQELLGHLLAGGQMDAVHLAEVHVKDQDDLKAFFSLALTPALYEVGRLWESGQVSVAQEHRASAVARRTVDALTWTLVPFRRDKGRALVTASPNEYHDLGGRILAGLLSGDGWEVDYLGANVPEPGVLDLIRLCRPHVLAISVAMPFNLQAVQRLIARVRLEPGFERGRVVVGGVVFLNDPGLWRQLGADGYAARAEDGIALLDGWWRELRA